MIGDGESAFKIEYLRGHKRDTYYGSRSPKAKKVERVARVAIFVLDRLKFECSTYLPVQVKVDYRQCINQYWTVTFHVFSMIEYFP